jgi:hypothetical protein
MVTVSTHNAFVARKETATSLEHADVDREFEIRGGAMRAANGWRVRRCRCSDPASRWRLRTARGCDSAFPGEILPCSAFGFCTSLYRAIFIVQGIPRARTHIGLRNRRPMALSYPECVSARGLKYACSASRSQTSKRSSRRPYVYARPSVCDFEARYESGHAGSPPSGERSSV